MTIDQPSNLTTALDKSPDGVSGLYETRKVDTVTDRTQYDLNGKSSARLGSVPVPIFPGRMARRESIAQSLGTGMSWGGVSVGSWIRDDIMMSGTSPFAFRQSPSYHSSSYLPKLEANFMRDFSCCGLTLPSIHDLLQHYEEEHAQKAENSGQTTDPQQAQMPISRATIATDTAAAIHPIDGSQAVYSSHQSQINNDWVRIPQIPNATTRFTNAEQFTRLSSLSLDQVTPNMAMLIFIACHLTNEPNAPWGPLLIRKAMMQALRSTNVELMNPSCIEDHTMLATILLALIEQILGNEEYAEVHWSGIRAMMQLRPDFKVAGALEDYTFQPERALAPSLTLGMILLISRFITSALDSALPQPSKDKENDLSMAPEATLSPAATVDSPWYETDAPPPPYMLSPTPLKQTCLIYAAVLAKK